MEGPVLKGLISTSAPAPRGGVDLTASTRPRQVSGTPLARLEQARLLIRSPLPRSPARVERHERPGLQPEASLRPGEPGAALQLRRGLPHERDLRQQHLSG